MSSIKGTLRGILSKSTGASLIGLISEGAGAVGRDVSEKLNDITSVMDYIPVVEHAAIYLGTSVYDATADIQSAIDAADFIFIPKGKFNITGLVVRQGTYLFGGGVGTNFTIIGLNNIGFRCLAHDTLTAADSVSWCGFSKFTINFSAAGQVGISYVGISRTTTRNIITVMNGFGSTGFKCISTVLAGSGGPAQWYNSFFDCFHVGNAAAALAGAIGWDIGGTLATEEQATTWAIYGGRTNNCKTGVWLKGCTAINFHDHVTEGNTDNWIIGTINPGERSAVECKIHGMYVEGGVNGLTLNLNSTKNKIDGPFMTSITGVDITDLGTDNEISSYAGTWSKKITSWLLKIIGGKNPVIEGVNAGLELKDASGNKTILDNNTLGGIAGQKFRIHDGVKVLIHGGNDTVGYPASEVISAEGAAAISSFYGTLNPPGAGIGKDGDIYFSSGGGGKMFQKRLGAWVSI